MNNLQKSRLGLAVLTVVYTVVAFMVPFTRNGTFWMSYVFVLLSIAAQLLVWKYAWGQGEHSAKSKFYGLPILMVGTMYLLLQLALGTLCMAFARWIPVWIPAILYVILLGAAAIGCIAADVSRSEVERIDHRQIQNTAFIKEMRAVAMTLHVPESEGKLFSLVEELRDKLRYSDPVSGEELREEEEKIAQGMDLLRISLSEKSYGKAEEHAEYLLAELQSRNAMCKAFKQKA